MLLPEEERDGEVHDEVVEEKEESSEGNGYFRIAIK